MHPHLLNQAYGVKLLWQSEEPEEGVIVPKGMVVLDGKQYSENPSKGPGTIRIKTDTPLEFFTFTQTSIDSKGLFIPDNLQTKLVWKTGNYTKSISVTPGLWKAFGTLEVLAKYLGNEMNRIGKKADFI